MSLPKHDPSLAKFITSLDPSMYSISGGESPSAPVAKEVEGLRNDLESRYRESNVRREAAIISSDSVEYISKISSPHQKTFDRISTMNENLNRSRNKVSTNSDDALLYGVFLGFLLVVIAIFYSIVG